MKDIVLASNNAGKLAEFQRRFASLDLNFISQAEKHVSSVPETGLSFVENAIIKARHAAKATGMPALSDDSGIEVDKLKGAPGIYSARYAGPNASDKDNVDALLDAMKSYSRPEERIARYQCVLVYMQHELDPTPLICQASWEGYLLQTPQGQQGFGYDPIFFVPSHQCSSAQLDPEEKNRISHRGLALEKLLNTLKSIQN